MAKKAKKTENVEVEPQAETMVETVITEEPKVRERLKPSNEWEIKDRMYLLKGGKKPLSRSIKSANIYYFDEEKVMKENLNIVKIKKPRL